MPYNLLILPLLGGYWLMKMSYRFRFIHQQLDRTHLLIWSSIAGFLLLFAARAIVTVMVWLFPEIAAHIKANWLSMEYLGTGLLAFLGGPISALGGSI
jgi:hypothetical protein